MFLEDGLLERKRLESGFYIQEPKLEVVVEARRYNLAGAGL